LAEKRHKIRVVSENKALVKVPITAPVAAARNQLCYAQTRQCWITI